MGRTGAEGRGSATVKPLKTLDWCVSSAVLSPIIRYAKEMSLFDWAQAKHQETLVAFFNGGIDPGSSSLSHEERHWDCPTLRSGSGSYGSGSSKRVRDGNEGLSAGARSTLEDCQLAAARSALQFGTSMIPPRGLAIPT